MKRVINGKMYNTETARELDYWSNGGTWRDHNHIEETLYRKKTGEYFLYGEGGPATKYAERVDNNMWSGGARIMPLTYAEATAWAEEHLTGDEYEAIFGPVEEDESRVTATFRLQASTLETLRRRSSEAGQSLSDYLESLLEGAL